MHILNLRMSVGTRIFLACVGLAIAVSLTASLFFYSRARCSLRDEVRSKLECIARTTAQQIKPSLHNSIRTRADESTAAYKELNAQLSLVRNANPEISCIYTLRPTKYSEIWQFVMDSESSPDDVSHVGCTYDSSDCPSMREGLFGAASDTEPIKDPWGVWISGYAPVKDEKGHTVAVVGIDMSAERLIQEESALRWAILENIGLALALAMGLSLLATRCALKPIRTLSQAAQIVRKGDLDFQIDLKRTDEIGDFVDSFNRMVRTLKESRDRLMEQSTHDFLTGLYNHRYFQQRLETEIRRSERYDNKLCLLILDLDRFKSINDSSGHPVGDSLLLQLGRLIHDNIRDIDIAARYGGDEFAIVLPEADAETGAAMAERIREMVEGNAFYAVPIDELDAEEFVPDERSSMHITVTVGIACYPDHHEKKDGLVMAADIALCRAKQIARNSVGVYESQIGSQSYVDPHDLYQMLKDPNAAAIQSLSAAVDAKDKYTYGHSERVTSYAVELGELFGLDHDLLDALKVAGLLHDLGKIGVPDAILNKNSGLTSDERESVQRHPSVAANILRRTPQFEQVVPSVVGHHERWDGSGYPDGLKGEQIPLMARILAIADSFDAMTSDRPYRKAMPVEAALVELKANAGKQFDPVLVELFISNIAFGTQDKAA